MLLPTASPFSRRLATGLCTVLAAAGTHVVAGTADISNTPLGAKTTTAKPNIMFILDDSGSMASEYMPDDMNDTGAYGYWSPQCNGLAFDPSQDYPAPIKADGMSYPDASIVATPVDGYTSGSSTINLAGQTSITGYSRWTGYTYGYHFYYTYGSPGTQTKMNWVYNSSGLVDTSTTFYKECTATIGNSPGSGKFTQVYIKDQSATVQQKYANWYAYYRNRLNLMRTAVGHAFSSLDSNYRVGFTMISDTGVTGSNFLNVADFSSSQKSSFYSKLYSSYSGSWTPLRGALSKVGRYFANRITGQTDPMQYSCQRNFALLSTDGYWNNPTETNTYGPYQLDGSTRVGQQDGTESRPMKDGTTTVSTTVVTSSTTDRNETTTSMTSASTRTLGTVATGPGSSGCASDRYYTVQQPQSCSINWTRIKIVDTTTTTTVTTVTTDGTEGTPTSRTTSSTSTISDTSRPSCTSWANSGSSTASCLKWNALPNGLSPGSNNVAIKTNTTDTSGTSSSTVTTTTTGPTTTTSPTTTTNGDSNSLADVAEYYWKTDLRTGNGWDDTLKPTATDSATHQHMNTYTVGLGVRGSIAYDRKYLTQTSGDYFDITKGTKNWPVPSGTVTSGAADATHIDDLWHAAVNGRGQYFSATDAETLSDAISTMLSRVKEETAAGAAAAASTLTPVTGDDWIFLPSYTTVSWYGDLRAFKFSFANGKAVAPSDTSDGTEKWSARKKLDARTTERTIYFKGSTGVLTSFTYNNLTTAALNGYFDNRCATGGASLSQCTSLSDTAKAKVTGSNLVAFLRGDRSLELNAAAKDDQVFRSRSHILGDFGNASPAFVGKPPFKYTDSGYANFVSTNSSRTKVIYAGVNDGMLHAFKVGPDTPDASSGLELWAYIPRAMMTNLWRLASDDYAENHRYYVDATPVAADIYDATHSRWRTVLVGGFGAGGRGYYALDVTTPESPEVLWEINAADGAAANNDFKHIGLSYGNPIITKNAAGTWVVAFTSGINNVSGVGDVNAGDGVGRLYVVDALTGTRIDVISTATGTTSTPSNLSRIEGWVEADTNNTALRFYGGDMLGNMWRFDHDDLIAPTGKEAFKLGTAKLAAGSAVQPITTKPLLNLLDNSRPVVAFGTGRYLGLTDLSDTSVQTVYAIKDVLGTTTLGDLQSSDAQLVQQSLDSSRQVPTVQPVDWATKNGWFVNLNAVTDSGERVNVDPIALSGGTLAFAATQPSTDVCTPGGTSYLYQFALTSGTVEQVDSYTKLIVGISTLVNSDGTTSAFVTFDSQELKTVSDPSTSSSGAGTLKRTTWRELIN